MSQGCFNNVSMSVKERFKKLAKEPFKNQFKKRKVERVFGNGSCLCGPLMGDHVHTFNWKWCLQACQDLFLAGGQGRAALG